MAITPAQIGRWFDAGVEQGATHMLVVCDTFDYEDYPVYVMPGEDVRARAQDNNGRNMTRLMEVYCLGMDKAKQLAEDRAFHYDDAPTP